MSELAAAFLDQAARHLQDDFMVKIRDTCDRLSEEQIWWRPNEESNSIGNLLLHLKGNLTQWTISGLGGAPDKRERELEFAQREPLSSVLLLEELEETVVAAVKIIRRLGPSELLELRPIQTYRPSGLQAVFHVVEHFAYHTGQILYIAKLLLEKDLGYYDQRGTGRRGFGLS